MIYRAFVYSLSHYSHNSLSMLRYKAHVYYRKIIFLVVAFFKELLIYFVHMSTPPLLSSDTRRGQQTPLQMVVDYHLVAGI